MRYITLVRTSDVIFLYYLYILPKFYLHGFNVSLIVKDFCRYILHIFFVLINLIFYCVISLLCSEMEKICLLLYQRLNCLQLFVLLSILCYFACLSLIGHVYEMQLYEYSRLECFRSIQCEIHAELLTCCGERCLLTSFVLLGDIAQHPCQM
jgi:hypothetical protein